MYDWKDFGFHIPQIMLPKKGTDYSRWAVVACDQFTSEPKYWEKVETIVQDAPSTLRLMLPEYYLGKPEEDGMIQNVRKNMASYEKDGILTTLPEGCILVRREAEGRSRLGLVIAVDLEAYDYRKGSNSLIRATEGTVVERIPPRLRIRRGAPLEMPHILILIDDPKKSVIEPLEQENGELIYDTDLMMDGGHVTGHFFPTEKLGGVKQALSNLMEEAKKTYGEGQVIFQAMGDGNHSLATAKANWEEIKQTLSLEEQETHPARFALCEIENVHDDGIVFEPIHRVAFGNENLKGMALVEKLVSILDTQNGSATLVEQENVQTEGFQIPYRTESKKGIIVVWQPSSELEVGVLQNALDQLVDSDQVEIDYIHGDKTVDTLAEKDGNVGFLLPAMDKFKLFPAVAKDGALPRKTFSMGEANEKRYYIEVRSLEK